MVLFVSAFYWLGILGAKSVGGGFSARELAGSSSHTLVPIAAAYVGAHYFTLLLYQGQSMAYLASDPLGDGSNIFGTAGWQVHYGLIGSSVEWYVKVAMIVTGHVSGLILAHDRASPCTATRVRRCAPSTGCSVSCWASRCSPSGSSRSRHVILPIAHAGHWLTGIAYFLPVICFLVAGNHPGEGAPPEELAGRVGELHGAARQLSRALERERGARIDRVGQPASRRPGGSAPRAGPAG